MPAVLINPSAAPRTTGVAGYNGVPLRGRRHAIDHAFGVLIGALLQG